MAELTAPVREAERLLNLVPFLDAHPYISISELAKEFGVTPDEMRKTLTTLSMCGAPGMTPYDMIEVSYENDFVTINQHDDLNRVRSLTAEESLSTLLGLELLRADITDSNLQDVLDTLIGKFKASVGNAITFDITQQSEVARRLQTALLGRRHLLVRYANADSTRTIEPLNIVEDHGELYCEAFCFAAEDFRTFRIDRLEVLDEIEASEKPIAERKNQSSQRSVEVRIHQNKRLNSERFRIDNLATDGKGKISYFSERWLVREVLAAGGDVEVSTDKAIRSKLFSEATKILKLYED